MDHGVGAGEGIEGFAVDLGQLAPDSHDAVATFFAGGAVEHRDLVPETDEVGHDRATDEPLSPGDGDPHCSLLDVPTRT